MIQVLNLHKALSFSVDTFNNVGMLSPVASTASRESIHMNTNIG